MKKFTLRLEEVTLKKLQKIAEREHRSVNEQIILLAQTCVHEFEAEHGLIPPAKNAQKASP